MHYFEGSKLKSVALHFIGNKGNMENVNFSKGLLSINKNLQSILSTYFLSPFKSEEYYQFYHESALSLNEVHTYISDIFLSPNNLHKQSINIAKHLYSQSIHPKIKGGELYVAYFQDCVINGETTDMIGLFKSENKDIFLKIFSNEENFQIETDKGININKLDKGCLIFNMEKENGYYLTILDNINKGSEAQYWVDDFLHVRQKQDKYFNTENTLAAYKDYILNRLPDEYEVTRADQADLLNRSISFFKDKESFKLEEFTNEVLQFPEYIKSFNQFKTQYEQEKEIDIADSFMISEAALKRQSRHFKSVIKLDKNFHIYIHGDKELIEKGYDDQKRMSYYKVYFKEEN